MVGFGGVNSVEGIFVGQNALTATTDPSGHFLVVRGRFCFCGHNGSEGLVLQSIGAVTLFFSDDGPSLAILLDLDGPVALVPGGAGHVALEI